MADDEDQVAKNLGVIERLQVNGFAPCHPVALFNSLSGCVLEVVESKTVPKWAGGGALWVDVNKITGATLANVSGLGHSKTKAVRQQQWRDIWMQMMMDIDGDGDVTPAEVLEFLAETEELNRDETVQSLLEKYDEESNQPESMKDLLKELKPIMLKIMATLVQSKSISKDILNHHHIDHEASTEYAKHMQLRDGWKDPEGIKVRPRQGLAAMECLVANDPSGLASKLGAALMLGVTSKLKEFGYKEGENLRGYGYDWRTPCTKLEERDGYYSKTMDDMEDLYKKNGKKKIVVVTHSLGGVLATYFFHWVACSEYGQSKGGSKWIQKHIQSFCPIGGPLLGTPYGSASYLSGDEGQGLAPTVFSFADRHLVVRSWGMFGMIFPTGRHLRLQPTRSVHWVRKEGLLRVNVLSVAMNTKKMPSYVRLTFTAPVSGEQYSLKTTTQRIDKVAGLDEHFQFAWCSTPESMDSATLEVAFMEDMVGPIDREIAKMTYEFEDSNIHVTGGVEDGKYLEGIVPNEWTPYEFKLQSSRGKGVIVANMQFVPHTDTPQFPDTPSAKSDKGAWRCGGARDKCSTRDKRYRLLEALGREEGKEWEPEVMVNAEKKHMNATYAPMTIDQMMAYDQMHHEYKWWKELYNDDEIWRKKSTERPKGLRRIRPIYGINVPTLVGNVYRRQASKRFVKFEPTTTMKLDKHCQVKHPGYNIKDGIVEEVPHKTPQADDPLAPLEEMTFNTRASGDGTVAYWSLKWPVTWRSSNCEVEPVEVEGADHRNILDKPETALAVLTECCSHPIHYLIVELDSLAISKKNRAMFGSNKFLHKPHTVALAMNWRGVDFVTDSKSEKLCTGNDTKLWSQSRFVFGVTQEDMDEGRMLEISVRRNPSQNVPRPGTNLVTMPIKELLSVYPCRLPFDEAGEVNLLWRCRLAKVGTDGMPVLEGFGTML